MKIPVSAKVICQDGMEGTLSLLVIDARSSRLAKLVIETKPPVEGTLPQDRNIPVERVIPVEWVAGMAGSGADANDAVLILTCTAAQVYACPTLRRMTQLSDPGAIRRMSTNIYESWSYYYIASLDAEKVNLPSGEVWIDRKAGVITRDERRVGSVAALEFDPSSRRLTGLIIHEGNFWKRREVALPITNVNRIENGTVYINQPYQRVAHLPGVPVH